VQLGFQNRSRTKFSPMCRGNELDVDDEYDHDGGLAMFESRAKKGTKEQQVKRQKAAQIADYRCIPPAQDFCLDFEIGLASHSSVRELVQDYCMVVRYILQDVGSDQITLS